jgi:hypothetical protein
MQDVPDPDGAADAVPLSIEPVLGWRVWRLGLDRDGRPELRSTFRPDVWPAGEPMRAWCATHRRATVPSRSCMCGLYATSSPKELGRAGVINHATVVVGAIAMWGRVIEHERGARARFAYPARLAIVCGRCLADGRGAIAAAHVIDVAEGLFALCGEHLRVTDGVRNTVEVQADLLSAYGVDPLPLERVARELRRPRSSVMTQPLTVGRLLEPVFAAIGFVFNLVMSLFIASAFLGVVASLIGGVLGLFDGSVDPRPTPAASPAPVVGSLCGRSDGSVVHIVDCAEPADLWGFAAGEPPGGPEHDCAPGWLADTREPDRWICWHALPGETPDVRAWTPADGEWFDEDGG